MDYSALSSTHLFFFGYAHIIVSTAGLPSCHCTSSCSSVSTRPQLRHLRPLSTIHVTLEHAHCTTSLLYAHYALLHTCSGPTQLLEHRCGRGAVCTRHPLHPVLGRMDCMVHNRVWLVAHAFSSTHTRAGRTCWQAPDCASSSSYYSFLLHETTRTTVRES